MKWTRLAVLGILVASLASAEVEDNGARIQYVSTAAQTDFDYPFEITADADLHVYVDGALQTLTTHYTVSGEGDDEGGTVEFVSGLDNGDIVTIVRNTEIARSTTFGQNAPLTSASFNREFDKLFTISQELEEKISRSLHLPETVEGIDFEIDPESFADSYLTFDEDGVPQPAQLSSTTVTQDSIGLLLYPRTTEEITAGITPTQYEYPPLNIYRYGGASADGTANSDQAAINSVVAVAEVNGGVIDLPVGVWNGCFSIDQPDVSIVGAGQQISIIECDNGEGITIGFTVGEGMSVIRDLGIRCTQGTDNYGILAAAHSTTYTEEMYGLTVERTWITDCEVAMHARTLRNFSILNNWWQSNDRALELKGRNLVGRIAFNEFVWEDVEAANDDIGIVVDGYTYAVGGFNAPEGLHFIGNQVYGFDVDMDLVFAAFVNVISNDFNATEYGIEFTTIQHGLTIEDNVFDMVGTSVVAGIIGHGLASEIETQVNLEGNHMLATSTTSAKGIVINDAGNQNQFHVNIIGNSFSGFDTNDILLNNAGFTTVRDNRCNSSDPTSSIEVTNVVSSKGPVIVEGNRCAKLITFSYAEVEGGEVIIGPNVQSGSALLTGHQPLHTQDTRSGAGAISINTRLTLVITSGANALTLADGFEGQEKIITMVTDGGDGTLTPTNLFNGSTITFNDVDDTVFLKFIDTEWHVISNEGATRG